MRWKVRELLKAHNRTLYALIEASGLTQTTIYAIAAGRPKAVKFETITKLSAGLEKLIGKPVEVGDLLEIVRD